MKPIHVAAVLCFGLALLNYLWDSKVDLVGGFFVLGLLLETIGWKDVIIKL